MPPRIVLGDMLVDGRLIEVIVRLDVPRFWCRVADLGGVDERANEAFR